MYAETKDMDIVTKVATISQRLKDGGAEFTGLVPTVAEVGTGCSALSNNPLTHTLTRPPPTPGVRKPRHPSD